MRSPFDGTAIARIHRHPVVLLIDLIPIALLFIAPLFLAAVAGSINGSFSLIDEITSLLPLVGAIYYLYTLLFAFYIFFDYFCDEWIITNDYIYDIEQKALFNRSVSKQEIHRIQDMKVERQGILATLFGYGDITIQSAGEQQQIFFKQVPMPSRIIGQITELLERERKRHHQATHSETPHNQTAAHESNQKMAA